MRAGSVDRMRVFARDKRRKVSPADSEALPQEMIAAAVGTIVEIVAMRGAVAGDETASRRDTWRPLQAVQRRL